MSSVGRQSVNYEDLKRLIKGKIYIHIAMSTEYSVVGYRGLPSDKERQRQER